MVGPTCTDFPYGAACERFVKGFDFFHFLYLMAELAPAIMGTTFVDLYKGDIGKVMQHPVRTEIAKGRDNTGSYAWPGNSCICQNSGCSKCTIQDPLPVVSVEECIQLIASPIVTEIPPRAVVWSVPGL